MHLSNKEVIGIISRLDNVKKSYRNYYRIFGHVARMDTSVDITRALIVSIRGLPKDWSRPPGRPRHT